MDFFKDFLNNLVYPLRIALIVEILKNHLSSASRKGGKASSKKKNKK